MSTMKTHAKYLFEHYKQGGAPFADMLYQRIIKQESLKLWEASALRREFQKLLKAAA